MIAERLERLVDEMVEKGVQFDDAVREFEKRFISRVLGVLRRQPDQDRRYARHSPQHADPQDGRVQDKEKGAGLRQRAPHPTLGPLPAAVSARPLTLLTAEI